MSIRNHFAACAILLAPALFGQVQQPGQLPSQADTEPLTLGEKYRVALNCSVDPVEFLRIGLGAGLDQARNYPREWGQGWDAFGVRVASGFGQQLIREQIEFGVWAIDHEDPRQHRTLTRIVADGLAGAFILGDLAVARLVSWSVSFTASLLCPSISSGSHPATGS